MRRTFSIATSEAAVQRGVAFAFLAYAAELRRNAPTGRRRQKLDHLEAIRLARATDLRAERMGLKLP
jgi:hypothetical protein